MYKRQLPEFEGCHAAGSSVRCFSRKRKAPSNKQTAVSYTHLERHEQSRRGAVHASDDNRVVQHKAVHAVGRRLSGVLARGGLRRGISREIQNARRNGVFVRAAQRKEVEQHLRVQAAVHVVQTELLVACLVVHDAHVALALALHHVDAVDLPDDAHLASFGRDDAQRLLAALADRLFKRNGAERTLALLGLQELEQARHTLAQARDEVGKARRCVGQVLRDVLVRQLRRKRAQLIRRELRERLSRAPQRVFEDEVHERAALERRQLRFSSRPDAQHVLQKI